MDTFAKIILGFASLFSGAYGLYAIDQSKVLEKDHALGLTMLFISIVFIYAGVFLIAEPEFKGKVQTKFGEQ